MSYFIGIMSGTSLDGIDVVIVDFNNATTQLIASSTTPYEPDIKQEIENTVNSKLCSLHDFCQLDRKIAKAYASAVTTLLAKNNIPASQIKAIGCHGQTIKHDPNIEHGYSLQIGDPNTLSALCNISVVADFRRKDVALGGQGAPLAPAFHQYAFQSTDYTRAIINIGGIANITILPKPGSDKMITGFDTGPGNTLLDHLCLKYFNQAYDKNGALAKTGHVNSELLSSIIKNESFFELSPPKSTGTDTFNLNWLDNHIAQTNTQISPTDLLTTVTELTALTIANSITQLKIKPEELYYCGGGQSNQFLMSRLYDLTQLNSLSTDQLGIHPDWVEAVAFAWFAKNTLQNKTSNQPSVTQVSKATILGGIYNA